MELRNAVGASVLLAGLAAGVTLGQDRFDMRSGGVTSVQVQPGAALGAGGIDPTSGVQVQAGIVQAGFADAGPLSLNRLHDGAYPTSVRLYNPHLTPKTIELTAQLLDGNGEPFAITLSSKASLRWEVKAGEYKTVAFKIEPHQAANETDSFGMIDAVGAAFLSSPMSDSTLRGHLPARGRLVARQIRDGEKEGAVDGRVKSGDLPTSPQRALTLNPPLPSPMDTGVLLASLFLAGAVTFLSTLIILGPKGLPLSARMGNVTFDFNRSWGSNVAIGMGLLNVLISQTQASSDRTVYLLLSGLFAAFVPLGSVLYGLIRPSDAGTQPQGYVIMYLLSSGVVLWGAFGELLLLGMILRDLSLARMVSQEPACTLILVTKGLILFLIFYAVGTARAAVKTNNQEVAAEASSATPLPSAALI